MRSSDLPAATARKPMSGESKRTARGRADRAKYVLLRATTA